MGGHERYTAQQVIKAIQGSGGIVTLIAKRLGCSWHTARNYIDKYPTARRAYEDEDEKTLDLAESKVIEAINAGDGQMVRYYLSTRGRKRGYVERQEVTGAEGERLIPEPTSAAELVRELNRLFDAARTREARATDRAESLPTLE